MVKKANNTVRFVNDRPDFPGKAFDTDSFSAASMQHPFQPGHKKSVRNGH